MSPREWVEWAGVALAAVGVLFFTAGTAGMLRFPDALSRLHALAKADNLGLGFVVVGLALQAGSASVSVRLALTWGLALLSGAACTYLIAGSTRRGEGGDG